MYDREVENKICMYKFTIAVFPSVWIVPALLYTLFDVHRTLLWNTTVVADEIGNNRFGP